MKSKSETTLYTKATIKKWLKKNEFRQFMNPAQDSLEEFLSVNILSQLDKIAAIQAVKLTHEKLYVEMGNYEILAFICPDFDKTAFYTYKFTSEIEGVDSNAKECWKAEMLAERKTDFEVFV